MHGVPLFYGPRVPIATLFECLEGGDSLEDFLESFPTVSRELAIAVLEKAKHLLLNGAKNGDFAGDDVPTRISRP